MTAEFIVAETIFTAICCVILGWNLRGRAWKMAKKYRKRKPAVQIPDIWKPLPNKNEDKKNERRA